MQAVVFDEKRIALRKIPDPRPPVGEVLLAPVYTGICRTDIELLNGYMGFSGIPGHEFVARVAAGTDRFREGELVVGEINCGCGNCEVCRGGDERHCPTRTVLGILNRPGCMANYFLLPERNLHKVPDSVPAVAAVFTEPLAAAFRIIEQKIIEEPGSRVLVLGAGKLGVLVALVLDYCGFEVVLGGRHSRVRKSIFENSRVAVVEVGSIRERFKYVVDCSGRPEGLTLACELLLPRGVLILKSTTVQPPQFHPASLVIDEITVAGSRCGPFPPALEYLNSGKFPYENLVQEILPFDKAEEAFRRAQEPGSLKVILDWSRKERRD